MLEHISKPLSEFTEDLLAKAARPVPAAELAKIRAHLVKKHDFDEGDEGLIGNADDLDAMHEDVHDDEDDFQSHPRGEIE